jgi:hypothetical protein
VWHTGHVHDVPPSTAPRRSRLEAKGGNARIARIARIGIESPQRLGRHRWVAERTIGWLLSY